MKIKKFSCVYFLFLVFSCSLCYASDLLDDYGRIGKEGWVWRQNFNANYQGLTLDFKEYHDALSKLESDVRGNGEKTNFVAAGFTFFIKTPKGEIKNCSPQEMFPYHQNEKPLIFYSGEPFQSRDIAFMEKAKDFSFYPLQDNNPSPHRTRQHLLKKWKKVSDEIDKFSQDDAMAKEHFINNIKEFMQEDVTAGENNFYQSLYGSLERRFQSKKQLRTVEKQYFDHVVREVREAKNFEDIGKSGNRSWDIFMRYLHSEQALIEYFKENSIFKQKLEGFVNQITDEGSTIIGVILHIHSTRDICRRCSISLSEELSNGTLWIQDILNKCVVSYQDQYDSNSVLEEAPPVTFNVICSSKNPLSKGSTEPTFEGSRLLRRYAHGNDGRGGLPMDLVDADCKKYFVCVPWPYTDPTHLINF